MVIAQNLCKSTLYLLRSHTNGIFLDGPGWLYLKYYQTLLWTNGRSIYRGTEGVLSKWKWNPRRFSVDTWKCFVRVLFSVWDHVFYAYRSFIFSTLPASWLVCLSPTTSHVKDQTLNQEMKPFITSGYQNYIINYSSNISERLMIGIRNFSAENKSDTKCFNALRIPPTFEGMCKEAALVLYYN